MNWQTPLQQTIKHNVTTALKEDIGSGDLTAELIPEDQTSTACVIARETGTLCGCAWFDEVFQQLDPGIVITWHAQDGDTIIANQKLCTLHGHSRTLLSGERSALNFLQLLSAVATQTRQYVEMIQGTAAEIVDTRKTIPGLRLAQKYAVHCGGGSNHRLGLFDAILIKENHILAAGSIAKALQNAADVFGKHQPACQFIQIEVETLDELQQALNAQANMILLDNMSLDDIKAAVKLNAGQAILEASGGINLNNLRPLAETGINRISVGDLTKNIKAFDLSMRFLDT